MGRVIRLSPLEWPPHRPFTDPGLVDRDRTVIEGMIRDLYAGRESAPQLARPRRGRDRLIVTDSGRSHGSAPVAVVGFFGERRVDASPEVAENIERVNATMLENFAQFPLLLGYVSRLLADGFNYANLVVLADEVGIERWRDRAEHVPAATVLSPEYYTSVRIYNGEMPCGLGCWAHLRLKVVKYWDYRGDATWQAVRDFALPPLAAPLH